MKIKRTTLGELRNAELVQFISDVITRYDTWSWNHDLATLGMENMKAELDACFEPFKKKVSQQNRYRNTEQQNSAETERSDLIRNIYKTVEAQSHSLNSQISGAAKSTKSYFDRYGGRHIASLPYNEKSAVISKLGDDFSLAHATQWLDWLSLTESFAKLQSANKDYMSRKSSKTSAISYIKRRETEKLRKAVDNKFTELVNKLNAHSILGNPEDFKEIVNFINQQLKDYLSTVKVRKTLSAQAKEV